MPTLSLPAAAVLSSGDNGGILVIEQSYSRVRDAIVFRAGVQDTTSALADIAEADGLDDPLVIAVRRLEELRALALKNSTVLTEDSVSQFASFADVILSRLPRLGD